MLQEVRGKRVAHHVRRQVRGNLRHPAVALDDLPETLPGHALATIGQEQHLATPGVQRRAGLVEVARQPLPRLAAHRHDALLVALAPDPDKARVEPELANLERHQLGNPNAGGVERLQHRPVAQPVPVRHIGRSQQRLQEVPV